MGVTDPTVEMINRMKEGTAMVEPNKFAGVDLSKVDFVVNPSSLQSFFVTFFAALAVLISGTVTLIGFLSKADLVGAAGWVQSAAGLAYFTAIATVVGIVGLAIRSYVKHEEKKQIAESAENAVVATNAEAKELGLK